jgi:hypothetical protein
MLSKFLNLNLRDITKGVIIAVIGAVIGIVTATIEAGHLNFDWPLIGKTALLAAITYLAKNLFTNSRDEFLKKE